MKKQSFNKFKGGISLVVVCLFSLIVSAGIMPGRVFAKPAQPIFSEVAGMKAISDGVFVSTGSYVKVNMGLVVAGKQAAIIDTGYNEDEARRVNSYINEKGLELKYIILTHLHADHTSNLSMFQTDDTVIYTPSNTEDGQLITLGNRTFKVVKTIGHAANDHMSIQLVEEDILFAGDVVVTNVPSAVAFGGDFKGLISSLEMLRTKNYSIIVPGHGDIIETHEAIRADLDYLKNVEKYVARVVDNGGTLEDALNISLEDCAKDTRYFDDVFAPILHQMTIQTAYSELSNK